MASPNNTDTQSIGKPDTMASTPAPALLDQRCDICYEYVPSPTLELTTLPCGHSFHPECICQWIQESENNDCPLCRAPLVHTCSHPPHPAFFTPGFRMSSLLLDTPCARYCSAIEEPHFHPDDIYDWLNEEGPAPTAITDWLHGRGEMPREVLPFACTCNIRGRQALHPPQVPTLEWFRESVLRPLNRGLTGDLRPSALLQKSKVRFEQQLAGLYQKWDIMTQAVANDILPRLQDDFYRVQDSIFRTHVAELITKIDVCEGKEGAQKGLQLRADTALHTAGWNLICMRDWLTETIHEVNFLRVAFTALHENKRHETLSLLTHALELFNDPETHPQHKLDLSKRISRASQQHLLREEQSDHLDATIKKFDLLYHKTLLHSYYVGMYMGTSYDIIPDADERALKTLHLKVFADERCATAQKLWDDISDAFQAEEFKKLRADIGKHVDGSSSDEEEDKEQEGDYTFTTQMIENAIQQLSPGNEDEEHEPEGEGEGEGYGADGEEATEEDQFTIDGDDLDPSVMANSPNGEDGDQDLMSDFEDPMPSFVPDEYPLPGTPTYIWGDETEDDDHLIASANQMATHGVHHITDWSHVVPPTRPADFDETEEV